MEAGSIIAPRQVLKELALGGDELAKWAEAREVAFLEADEAVQACIPTVLEVAPPSWGPSSPRNTADPWVVALALARQATVATYEGISFSGQPSERARMNILWVCNQIGVLCVNPLVVFRELRLGGA